MINPMFNTIKNDEAISRENVATYRGITIKTIYFVLVAVVSAISFALLFLNSMKEGDIGTLSIALVVTSIVGFMSVMMGRGKIAGTVYAICEGAFIGFISLIGEIYYPGVVMMAAISTAVVFCVMLALFASGVIRNKSKFMSFGISLGSSIVVILLITMILSLFGFELMTIGPVGIAIDALIMIYACVSLLMNFTEASTIVQNGFAKEYEWTCAFGFLISILFIYVQILRLLMIILEMTRNN